MIGEYLNIPKTAVLQILKEDLGKRRLCAHFVLRSLTPEQRKDRVTSCQDVIAMADAGKNFSNKIIAGDETCCFAYVPETKRQSSEWVGETSPLAKETEIPKVLHQDNVDNFFDPQRHSAQRIHTGGKKTVNAEFYKGAMDCLLKRIQRVCPAAFCCRDFYFFTRQWARPQSCKCSPVFDLQKCYLLSPPVLCRFISAILLSVPQVEN
jgi:hypothetical protein